LNPDEADPRFYFYWLQSFEGRNAIRSIVEQGAGAAGIRGSDLQNLDVVWCPIDVQREIADVLSVLDDKIELNRRMNDTLEAMARAIFQSWFVDFDPVRAKAVDLIDEGVLAVGDGYRAKNDELGAEGVPFIRAAELNNGFNTHGADRLRPDRLTAAKGKFARVGDVAFTSKGTVGRFARVGECTELFVYSPQICFWRSLDPQTIHPAVLYCWMQSSEFVSQIEGASGQTDMAPYVSLRDQKSMKVPRFHESQHAVGERISPLLRMVSERQAESRTLEMLRDSLLPKLLSGKLSPGEALA
jgi:type I restriction enzyme S subunit